MWSSVSSLSYCPNSCLLDNHFLTHTLLCILLRGGDAFCSSSASFSLFFCSSTTARAAARYRHLLFSATTVSLAFSMFTSPTGNPTMTWGMEHPFLYGVPKSPRWRVNCANWSGQCLKCVNSPHTMRKYVLPVLHAFVNYEWTLREVVANTAGTLRQPPSACHQRARFTTTKFVAMRTHKSCKCQPRLMWVWASFSIPTSW